MPKTKAVILSVLVIFSTLSVGFSNPDVKILENSVSSLLMGPPDTILIVRNINRFADSMAMRSTGSLINTIFGIRFDFSISHYLSVHEQLREEIKSKKISRMEKWEEGYSDNRNNARKGYPHYYARFDTLGNLTAFLSGFGRILKWDFKYQLQYHSNGQIKKLEKFEAPNHLVYLAEYLNDSICLSEHWFENSVKTILFRYEYDSTFRLIGKKYRYLYKTYKNCNEFYNYDRKGRIIGIEGFGKLKERMRTEIWSYNNLGLVDSISFINKKGKQSKLKTFSYDENHLVRRLSFSKRTSSYTNDTYYQYDSLERMTEILQKWGDGHSNHHKWKYNSSAHLSQFSYFANRSVKEMFSYSYDSLGNAKMKNEYVFADGSGKPRQQLWQNTIYKYNENGLFKKIEVNFEFWPGIVYNFYYEYYD